MRVAICVRAASCGLRGGVVALLLLCGTVSCSADEVNAFTAQERALQAVRVNPLGRVRKEVLPAAEKQASAPGASAYDACYAAELMRLTGDYGAVKWYETAIQRAPQDPTYEFAYAQYLRIFRGALEPLFQKSEAHLFSAERKFACLTPAERATYPEGGTNFSSVLARALADLYQRDGVAIAAPPEEHACIGQPERRISVFESFGARGGRSNVDFDRQSLIRDLTAGLMLAQSRPPLNFPGVTTPTSFLIANLRDVTAVAGVERLRLRLGNGPAIDAFLVGQNSDNAQITQYVFDPRQPAKLPYNSVKLGEYGFSVDQPFTLGNLLDAAAGVTYRRVRRWGVIEFLPKTAEDIDQVDVHAALSRFIGPDKLNAEFNFSNQSITPRNGALSRDRQLYGGTLTYQIFRYASAYARKFQNTRGIDLSGGILHDLENYPFSGGVTAVTRRDYFVGTTIRAFHGVDINVQPTWFTSSVSTDKSQHNSQYETAGYLLRRIVDEERTGGLPQAWHGLRLAFLHLAVPFHHDLARTGSAAFENYKVGAELDAKWFSSARRGVTFLGSVRYDYQSFYNLNRTFNIVTGNLTMGF